MSLGVATGRVWVLVALGVGAVVAGEVQRLAGCLLVLVALGQVLPPLVVPLLGLRLTALALGGPRLAVRGQVRGVLVSLGWPWPGVAYWYAGAWRSPLRAAVVFLTPLLLDALAALVGLALGAAATPGWGRSLVGAALTLLLVHAAPWRTEDGGAAPVRGALRALRRRPGPAGALGFDEADDLVGEGRGEEVRRHAEALLSAEPSWQAHELAALAAEYDGRPGGAARHVRAALALAPEDQRAELALWEAELTLQQAERDERSGSSAPGRQGELSELSEPVDPGRPDERSEPVEPPPPSVQLAVDLTRSSTAAPHHLGQALLTRARVRAAVGDVAAARRDVDLADRLLPHHPRVELVRDRVLHESEV